METLYRRWQILTLIPRYGNSATTSAIAERLAATSLEATTLRTIQRDLEELSRIFPIISELSGRANLWSWMEGRQVTVPAMDPHTALTFHLFKEYLRSLLPSESFRYLEPFFRNADEILAANPELPLSEWPDKIRVVSRSLAMQPPLYQDGVVATVYEAVLRGKRLSMRYRLRGGGALKEYPEVNPLGLVFVDNLIYLVASLKEYPNALQFLLHRMESAVLQEKLATIPESFTLQGYIESGEFSYPLGKETIRLKALFAREAAAYLHDTPAPGTLSLTDYDESTVLLEAEVADSRQLRWWLRGFGDEVEVLEPSELRKEFTEMVENLVRIYDK